ncbi:MAG: methyl-accepting chemotaxis protein [candidate division WOR-3 bacterium]|nr:methyl-accepting chemotaxis protein [candidate division WOR-3 bacterium]
MLLRIYSPVRFLLTLILLGAAAWFGFSAFGKLQTRTNKALAPNTDLIRVIKDSQINLEKYRLFEQIVQLEAVAADVDLTEIRLNELSKTPEFKKAPIVSVIDSSRKLIKLEKEMIADLKSKHQEYDLSKAAISTLGELRTEFGKNEILILNLQKLSLAETENWKNNLTNQVKNKLIMALVLVTVLYAVELALYFLFSKRKRPPETAKKSTVTESSQLADVMLVNQRFQRIEEAVEDIGERISIMAFNALLEATRAGESGKGFKVVAEELQKLADRSVQSAGNVKKILEETTDLLSHADTTKS